MQTPPKSTSSQSTPQCMSKKLHEFQAGMVIPSRPAKTLRKGFLKHACEGRRAGTALPKPQPHLSIVFCTCMCY